MLPDEGRGGLSLRNCGKNPLGSVLILRSAPQMPFLAQQGKRQLVGAVEIVDVDVPLRVGIRSGEGHLPSHPQRREAIGSDTGKPVSKSIEPGSAEEEVSVQTAK